MGDMNCFSGTLIRNNHGRFSRKNRRRFRSPLLWNRNEGIFLRIDASMKRTELLQRACSLETGIDAANSIRASNSLEIMLVHQMSACHVKAMGLIGESISTWRPTVWTKAVQCGVPSLYGQPSVKSITWPVTKVEQPRVSP